LQGRRSDRQRHLRACNALQRHACGSGHPKKVCPLAMKCTRTAGAATLTACHATLLLPPDPGCPGAACWAPTARPP
jgi:hypothetical protein